MQLNEAEQVEWLDAQFKDLTIELKSLSPSQWAEQKRYLPPQVTPLPGPFRFDVAPYLREIVDCLDVQSPVRELAVMKGAQLCMTVGVLENAIGYCIDEVRTAPVMLVTADSELVKLRMDANVTPMLQHSGLEPLIKSSDVLSKGKAGKTDKRIEWFGGGYLLPFGAKNSAKMRSFSIQFLLNDEIDGWPVTVGKDGDPVKLVRSRTNAYEASRKILDISTPTIEGLSKIKQLYERGDQRKYLVRCLRCEHPQELRWSHTDNETGVVSGIVWETEGEQLVPDSVRYLCQHCGHAHCDADKGKLLAPEYGAAWHATAVPVAPDVRSYHLSALYSPPGMQSWTACVQMWLEAWDVAANRPRDVDKLQVFYNNVLGQAFKPYGARVRYEAVSAHKRDAYSYGEIPNAFATEHCGGPILLLTCAVDVHKDRLKVAVFGWTRDRRAFLIEYLTLEGDTEHLDDAGTWGALRDVIEDRTWKASDGKIYRVQTTFIDSGYNTDRVYSFCGDYEGGVFPIKGQAVSPKAARVPLFSPFKSPVAGYGVTVDLYKDRWSSALRREWSGLGPQPPGHFNAPCDATEKQLRELTAETKVPKADKLTGKTIAYEWHRTAGVANELWDLLVYNNAALDLLAWNFCEIQELESTDWQLFWQHCEAGAFFEE